MHPYAELKVDSEHFQLLEHFDKTSDLQHVNEARQEMFCQKEKSIQYVNEARQEMFCQKEKSMERLPPTQDALMQHTKRAAYQAGIWCISDACSFWGWTLAEDIWIPVWTKLPIAAQVYNELIKYGCKN